jgi:maltooligosyltrehalose trehalohydrolase
MQPCATTAVPRGGFRSSPPQRGANFDNEGRAHFHVLNASAAEMHVRLLPTGTSGERLVAMTRQYNGSYYCVCDGVEAGTRYWYVDENGQEMSDPWSFCQPDGVHGASQLIDQGAYRWKTRGWRGRRWVETVIYEMHIGAFTPEGTFEGACSRFPYLAALGFTAIQVMPVCATPHGPNWGYDATFPFAPESSYGTPDELKHFVDEAHRHGLQVILDVVYNHFGPEGNYLYGQIPDFFNDRKPTPWGSSLNFDASICSLAREFVIDNAHHWINEFRVDGLRIDAPHMMYDDSNVHILQELQSAIRNRYRHARHIHLILECENGQTSARGFHVVNQDAGHRYATFLLERKNSHSGRTFRALLDTLKASAGAEISQVLPLETHDDIGNNAHGRRVWQRGCESDIHLILAIVLLSPAIPLIFMGDERAERSPFHFFCRFKDISEAAILAGRAQEFNTPPELEVPPFSDDTFEATVLRWTSTDARSVDAQWLVKRLLRIRKERLLPVLSRGPCRLVLTKLSNDFCRAEWDVGTGRLVLEICKAEIPDTSKSEYLLFQMVTPEFLYSQALRLTWSLSPPLEATVAGQVPTANVSVSKRSLKRRQ